MSQGSLNVPTVGPVTPVAFAGDINTMADAIISKNSGGSAPTNFPTTGGAATAYQEWADTSPGGSVTDTRIFDGANWLITGSIDATANHYWMPKVGGGSGTIAAAGTTDIGSVRASYMTVTGSVPGTPITSFGSNALLNVGETKFLRFTAGGIITHNAASMIMPGAADLSFNAGDTLQAVYLGSGNWLAYDYRSNLSAEGRNTGDTFQKWATASFNGAVRANGGTIGDATSGATERANADTLNLFIFLYVNDTTLAISGGRTGTTRANAITDFNAHKTLTLPDLSTAGAKITTQYLTNGTGATYTTPDFCKLLEIEEIGSGGGGGGQGSTGSNGTATTFDSVNANPGSGGNTGGPGGAGGTGGTGAADLRLDGGDGIGNTVGGGGSLQQGNNGGSGFFGGAGKGGNPGTAGKANTGGGGGGGWSSNNPGSGGGAGEYVKFRRTSPAATYTYTVGVGGNGAGGGAKGGDGLIIVREHVGPTTYFAL